MAAAPHLFDDRSVASPELALVDVDLAAQLREEIRTGEEFRPRTVARPELHLVFCAEVPEDDAAAEDGVELPEYLAPHEDDEVVVDVEPVVIALDVLPTTPLVDELSELPDDVVAPVPEEIEGGAAFLDVTLDSPASEDVLELPDYVVRADDAVELEPVVVALDVPMTPPVVEPSELPDYVVAPEELPYEVEGATALLDVALDPPVLEDVSGLPDYVVRTDDLVVEEPTTSDYPVLPDLGEASVALEETDVALRRIREQLASEETPRRPRRLRRGFIAASGLGAVAALAVLAVDVQLGVATLPDWLGF